MSASPLAPTPRSSEAYQILCQLDDLFEKDDFHAVCRLFNSIDDDEVYEAVTRCYPNLSNYDAKGNYIGPVANENGWTP
jgi:hypothetical protein